MVVLRWGRKMVTKTELNIVGKGLCRMREIFRNPCVTPGHDFQHQLDKVDALQDNEASKLLFLHHILFS
jgi:hypothetical protein